MGGRRLLSVAWRIALAAAIATAAMMLVIGTLSTPQTWLYDFKGDLYVALRGILHGQDPYRPGLVAHALALKAQIGRAVAIPTKPPSILLAFLPFGLLPALPSGVLFVAMCAAAVFAALRLLGVRDWRCFALAFASWPVIAGLGLGNASPLLLLGAAAMWRWRERLWSPALALAGMVLLKIFPWVLGAWFVVRRQWRALALSVALALLTTTLAWAAIGFAGLTHYPKMILQFGQAFQGTGPSLTSFLFWMGLSVGAAQLIALACGGALVLAAWRLAQRPADQGRAFGLIVAAALIAAPYIWDHYTVLLFVPIALCSPTLSWVWFVPVLPDFVGVHSAHDTLFLAFWVAIQGLVVIRILWPTAGRSIRALAPSPLGGLSGKSGAGYLVP